MSKPSVMIVGPGRLGSALASALYAAGYSIEEIVARKPSLTYARRLARRLKARAVIVEDAMLSAKLVWICVGDSDIAETARTLASAADWKGKIAFHASGALTSDELRPLRRRGAAVASVHPMMTFVRGGMPSLAGVGFGLEGDAGAVRLARRIVADLKGEAFLIRKTAKPLYHAWGAFVSPLLVMELTLAERVARAAGVPAAAARPAMEAIVRQTIENYFDQGGAKAFTGPFVRGDVLTIQRHLKQLGKVYGAREVYVALAREALRTLPVDNRRGIEKLLNSYQSGQRRGTRG